MKEILKIINSMGLDFINKQMDLGLKGFLERGNQKEYRSV